VRDISWELWERGVWLKTLGILAKNASFISFDVADKKKSNSLLMYSTGNGNFLRREY